MSPTGHLLHISTTKSHTDNKVGR